MITYRKQIPTFVDLFSGCGGLSLGFLRAGYRCLLAIDNDPQAVSCYNLNLKGDLDSGAILKDLREFKTRDHVRAFLDEHRIKPSMCDVLVGGPPCQSFSMVGRNKIRALLKSEDNAYDYWEEKDNERAALFEIYARFVEVLQPRWFLFENVPTIQKHELFPLIIQRFKGLQDDSGKPILYDLKQGTYLASRYGVPQDRKRFFLIGHRGEIGTNGWQGPIKKRPVTVSQALGDLPKIPHGNKDRELAYSSPPKSSYQRMMRSEKPAGARGRVFDHICRTHNADDVALFARMQPGARFADPEVQDTIREINPHHKLIKYSTDKFKDKLHKLDPDKPAWTITAHLQKDCYKFIHHNQPRTITVREAARLQSFPDWFRFNGLPMGASFRLVGNAVPPLLAQAFAESFSPTFA